MGTQSRKKSREELSLSERMRTRKVALFHLGVDPGVMPGRSAQQSRCFSEGPAALSQLMTAATMAWRWGPEWVPLAVSVPAAPAG